MEQVQEEEPQECQGEIRSPKLLQTESPGYTSRQRDDTPPEKSEKEIIDRKISDNLMKMKANFL